MAKNLYRITENDLKVIMESVTKRVLKEGSSETEDLHTWEDIKETIGADTMLDMIWNFLDVDQLKDLMSSMIRQCEMDGIEF